MRKVFLLLTLVSCLMVANARINSGNERIEAVMADSKLKFQKGDNNVFDPNSDIKWRDGINYCSVVHCMNEKDEYDRLAFLLEDAENWEKSNHYYEVKIVNGAPHVINRKGVTVEHLVAGMWSMVVFRNAGGAVLDVALESLDRERQVDDDLRDMINGVYIGASATNAKDTVEFGAIYGSRNISLPGSDYQLLYQDYETGKLLGCLRVAYVPERMKRVHMPMPSKKVDDNGVTHYYGDDKEISRGEYEHLMSMPSGYGGHGSLHGPLWWNVKPKGNNLDVELKEPFQEELDAFYSNFREPKFTLKWVRSPYKGLNDRWSVLSMRPVTRGMISIFDKSTLQQMLTYLNNRKSLTDIEKLNKSLINTLVNGVSTSQKTGKSGKSSKSSKLSKPNKSRK